MTAILHDYDINPSDEIHTPCYSLSQAFVLKKLQQAGLPVLKHSVLLPAFFAPLLDQLSASKPELAIKNTFDAAPCLNTSISLQLHAVTFDKTDSLNVQIISSPIHTPEDLHRFLSQALSTLADKACLPSFFHRAQICALLEYIPLKDIAYSGNVSSMDTESGFIGSHIISAYSGEAISASETGMNDEYHVSKAALNKNKQAVISRNIGSKRQVSTAKPLFCIDDDTVQCIAKLTETATQLMQSQLHASWALTKNKQLYIYQINTIDLQQASTNTQLERFMLQDKSTVLIEGRAVGKRIASGAVRIINQRSDLKHVQQGDILVADMTDPDWEPFLSKAAAIITNRGGRTCHAAIIARELDIPAIVGCLHATKKLTNAEQITVSCAEGDNGYVYQGQLNYKVQSKQVLHTAQLPFDLLMNVGNPDRAMNFSAHPNNGVGLARLEFIINRMIGIHPNALILGHKLPVATQKAISRRTAGFDTPIDFYMAKLTEGVATIANAFYPKKVIVRLSDFKSNEYAHLIGGDFFEPKEENPMLGFRGASRYISDSFQECFKLECRALKFIREDMGLDNIEIMVPFCRTPGEAKQVVELLAQNGLQRGENGLRISMMCEIPANALLADQFLQFFDGFSIGSNDLTQLTLGVDRDSALVAHLFDEANESVKALFKIAIDACKAQGKSVGICGQAASENPELVDWLIAQGVDSLSLNPDAVLSTLQRFNQKASP